MKDKLSILVVDDEPTNFDVIEAMFLDTDHQLYYSSNGEEALSSLGVFFQPDIILLDVMMPGMDGMEVCRRIKARPEWQAIPIIMVTALVEKENLAQCLSAGADDFVGKPVSRIELRARVQSMARIKYQYDAIQSASKLQQETIQLLEGSLGELHGNLTSTFPHQLNTPLSDILSSFYVLKQHGKNMDAEAIHDVVDVGLQSTKRLETFTQRFLTYLNLEAEINRQASSRNNASEPVGPCTIASFIPAIVMDKAMAFDRAADLSVEVDKARIGITSNHLKCLIEELLDNAFKFSQPQTPVRVRCRAEREVVCLQIEDSGRGLGAAQAMQIGNPLQIEASYLQRSGIGLGLGIAQRIAKLYGGKLAMPSTSDRGTTVRVELPPAAPTKPATPTKKTSKRSRSRSS